jgi:hypothetical protein
MLGEGRVAQPGAVGLLRPPSPLVLGGEAGDGERTLDLGLRLDGQDGGAPAPQHTLRQLQQPPRDLLRGGQAPRLAGRFARYHRLGHGEQRRERLMGPPLQPAALGHVVDDADGGDDVAVVVAHGRAADADLNRRPAGDLVADVHRAGARQHLAAQDAAHRPLLVGQLAAEFVADFGFHASLAQGAGIMLGPIGRREHAPPGGVHAHDALVGAEDDDGVRHRLERGLELARPRGSSGPRRRHPARPRSRWEIGDVGAAAHPLAHGALGIQHGDGPHPDGAVGAVAAAQAPAGRERLAARHRGHPCLRRGPALVGVERLQPTRAADLLRALAGEGAPGRCILHQPIGRRRPDDLARGGRERGEAVVAGGRCRVLVRGRPFAGVRRRRARPRSFALDAHRCLPRGLSRVRIGILPHRVWIEHAS